MAPKSGVPGQMCCLAIKLTIRNPTYTACKCSEEQTRTDQRETTVVCSHHLRLLHDCWPRRCRQLERCERCYERLGAVSHVTPHVPTAYDAQAGVDGRTRHRCIARALAAYSQMLPATMQSTRETRRVSQGGMHWLASPASQDGIPCGTGRRHGLTHARVAPSELEQHARTC